MRRLEAHLGLAGVAASLLLHPALALGDTAQEIAARAAPPSITVVEAEPATREQQAAQAEYAKRVQERGVFGVFLTELDEPRRAIACGTIAEHLAAGAATASDPRERAARLPEAWRLTQRVAAARERALATLTQRDIARFETTFGQVMTMASIVPDPEFARRGLDTSEGGFAYQFASILAMRCHQSLDENGVPDDASEPTADFIDQHTRFRFRGMDYAVAFAETGLAPFAKSICRNQTAFDFTDAPLDQRGQEGLSLLDWATECEDRAAF